MSGHLPSIYWKLMIGAALGIAFAPAADHPVDVLRLVEIGMTLTIYALLIDFAVQFQRRHRVEQPTAATPAIVWTLVAAYMIALAGNTIEVLQNYSENQDALHPPVVFGFVAQLAALAWVVPFLSKLYREAPDGSA